MTDNDRGESRLSRWSKRKIAVAQEDVAEEESPPIEPVDTEEQAAQDAELQARLQANREAAEAVDLETLTEESDFSVFMKDGVPEMLKKKAMASLWRVSPIFANVDGLVDYDDDFGSPDLIMKTFKSAYQAGRGYLDLFDEKDEASEEVTEPTLDDAPTEPIEEIEDSSENDEELLEEVEETASAVDESAPLEEPEIVEADLPKVSLRKRLELDRI